jgi:hypothetical protein
MDVFNVTLDTLPTEVLYHLVSFLDPRTILCSLRFVNIRFHTLFSAPSFWRSMICNHESRLLDVEDLMFILSFLKCPYCGRNSLYPPIPQLTQSFWCKSCRKSSSEPIVLKGTVVLL